MSEENTNLGFFKKSAHEGLPYFHIFDHSICQKSKTQRDGWEGPLETTHPGTGATVHTWVMRYDSLAVYVIDSNRFKKEFTKEQGGGKAAGLDLTLEAGTMRAILSLKVTQNGPEPVLKRFLKVAPNIDFSKPLLISAFENREGKQAVSFRQGDDPDPKKWVKVDEYWRRPLGPDGKPVMDSPSTGADGSVLPEPIQDEFTEKWDYSVQNSFLLKHYMQHTEPKLKAIAEAKGLNKPPEATGPETDDDGFPTHSGVAEEIPVVTTKPDNVIAQGTSDAATGAQRAKIRQLSTQANFDFEAKCQEVMGCPFDSLNKLGASFAIYKLEQMIANHKTTAEPAPVLSGMAVPPPEAAAVVTAPSEPAPEVTLGDDWGTATAPAAVPTTTMEAHPSLVTDDDIPWGND